MATPAVTDKVPSRLQTIKYLPKDPKKLISNQIFGI
jgi:hypothetical protein